MRGASSERDLGFGSVPLQGLALRLGVGVTSGDEGAGERGVSGMASCGVLRDSWLGAATRARASMRVGGGEGEGVWDWA